MGIDLPLIWAVIIIFGIMMYVVMDGFDLGIGILFPFIPGKSDRDVMMNTVAPVWDGNETWLVLGRSIVRCVPAGLLGGALGVVPAADFHADRPDFPWRGLRVPLQGQRCQAPPVGQGVHRWFGGGHLLPGRGAGAFIDGLPVVNRQFAGGSLDWLTPFTMFCGAALVVAYALLGCTWLIMKTEGKLQEQMHDLARPLAFVLLAVIGIVSIWTPLAHAEIAARWFTLPNLFWFLPVPILVLVTLYGLIRAVARNAHYTPFLLTLVLIFLGYSGLGISLWPNIVPPSISIWDAAAPPQSQGFMLVGTLFIIPFILGYTFWSYYVFRGKVTHEDGYH